MLRKLPKITDFNDWQGKYVLLRTSLNVPVKGGEITDMFRLKQALPTIKYLSEAGGRVIILGHIGRDPETSLKSVWTALNQHHPIVWAEDLLGEVVMEKRNSLENGEVMMLENVRSEEGEKKMMKSLQKL